MRCITAAQAAALERALDGETAVKAAWGFRYGAPRLEEALDRLIADGCERFLLLPLFPQYARATTLSASRAAQTHLRRRGCDRLRVARPFFDEPLYLDAQAEVINAALAEFAAQRLILSFHAMPERAARRGDPYAAQCRATARLLVPRLRFPAEAVHLGFQSRFGPGRWTGPATADLLASFADQGVRRVLIAFPGFAADCIETLDEIGDQAARHFAALSGGGRLQSASCLNAAPAWIAGLAAIVRREIAEWDQAAGERLAVCGAP